MVNMYICERIQFVYFYKRPPMIGNDLNEQGLKVLQYAPIGMMLCGYWLVGNRQMFFNHSPFLSSRSEIYNPGHHTFDYDDGLNYTVLLLMFAVIIFFFNKANIFLQKIGQTVKLFTILKTNKDQPIVDNQWNLLIDVDEHLGNYWECIRGQD